MTELFTLSIMLLQNCYAGVQQNIAGAFKDQGQRWWPLGSPVYQCVWFEIVARPHMPSSKCNGLPIP